MKKLLTIVAILFCMFSLSAEMTWADYEKLCWQEDVEPTYEGYEKLMSGPETEYGDDDGSESAALLEKNWNTVHF